MGRFGIVAAATLMFGMVGTAIADPVQSHLQVGVDNYGWKEFFPGGAVADKESGPLLTLGGGWDDLRRIDSGVIYSADGQVYVGRVDYSGYSQNTQNATLTPMTSKTNYFGFSAGGFGGYRIARDLFGVDLFGGGDLDAWRRSISNATDATGNFVAGYTENYVILNFRLGAGLFQELGSWSYRLEAGAKYPVYTFEHVAIFDGINVSPGKKASAFAKLSLEFGPRIRNHFGLILSYDSYRFGASNLQMLTSGGVPVTNQSGSLLYGYQPESHQDVYRLSLAYYFR